MGESLRDQLLKAGLVDRQKAKQIETERRKQERQEQKGRAAAEDEARARARQAQAEKAERDRQLNLQRQQEAQRRSLMAQARQLIEQHRVAGRDGDLAYQFQDGTRIKKVYVNPAAHQQLVAGTLVIARLKGRFELIPAEVAERVRERHPALLVQRVEPTPAGDLDEAYAAYPVPDDLMW